MKSYRIGFIALILACIGSVPVHATHLFRNSASNLNTGTVPNERIDGSSITKQGNSVQFSNGNIIFGDGSQQTTAAGSSQWATNGTHIYPTNTGNVGVGTQNPTGRLDVRGALVTTGTVNLAGANGNVGIGTLTTGTSLLDIFGGSLTIRGSGAALSVNGTGLVVQNAGNVGMGTVSPSSLLDINGGSLTIRGSGAALSVQGPASMTGPATINGAAGSAAPQFIISTGTSKLFEVTPASITLNVPLFLTQVATVNQVMVYSANGYGGTNTAIRRWSNTLLSSGSCISYADSSTLGSSFTISCDGLYSVNYTGQYIGSGHLGVSVNSNQLTTTIQSINVGNRVCMSQTPGANLDGTTSCTVFLKAGDIIRTHDDPQTTGSDTNADSFKIMKIYP